MSASIWSWRVSNDMTNRTKLSSAPISKPSGRLRLDQAAPLKPAALTARSTAAERTARRLIRLRRPYQPDTRRARKPAREALCHHVRMAGIGQPMAVGEIHRQAARRAGGLSKRVCPLRLRRYWKSWASCLSKKTTASQARQPFRSRRTTPRRRRASSSSRPPSGRAPPSHWRTAHRRGASECPQPSQPPEMASSSARE